MTPFFSYLCFYSKINRSSVLDTVSLRIPFKSVSDHSAFTAHCNFKVSPKATIFSAANAVRRSHEVFFLVKIVFFC